MQKVLDRLVGLNYLNDESRYDHLRLVLFAAVLHGFRAEKVFKPFPEVFYLPGTKEPDLQKLRACFHRIDPTRPDKSFEDSEVLKLLEHIMFETNVDFKKISYKEHGNKELINLVSENTSRIPATKPTHVFKIIPKQNSAKYERFQNLKSEHGSFFAFHGTKLQNVRSILEFGLANIFNERQLYGDGIYMSKEIAETFLFSPFAENMYVYSPFGSQLSAILVCEVIKHPHLFDKEKNKNVPATYYIVPNTDWIRVECLMLYDKSRTVRRPNDPRPDLGFFPEYGTIVIISLFFIMIATGYIMTINTY